MSTYNLDLCQDCATHVAEGSAIEPNPSMGELGLIVIIGEDFELKRSDCGACGTHMTGNFIAAEEYSNDSH